ncbi:putative transcription factor B3-Domain family [Medicago truncatula]|uniref:Putative transcription factor B3-Domain family n=1 Tax=Medicago truncatula TaxID=3880 RepID=A0A396I2U1_MEDTR|nr:putative transcription factor B3-Domain family [Medicago truncatula]
MQVFEVRFSLVQIPDEFITRFGNELDNVATITVPGGREWDMELKKCGGQVFFCNNWQHFAEYYSISYSCYLDFKYEENSNFVVVIYDPTFVEISYPFKTPSTNGDQSIKGPNSDSKRANCAAGEFNPKNPYFHSKSIKGIFAYVPSGFAKKYLMLMVLFMLQNYQGKQWEVYCILNTKGNSSMRITSGFSKFARENNLSEGVTWPPQGRSSQSLTEKEVRESEHFKMAILPSPIHDKEIRISDEFITRFGIELKNVATVTAPDGRDWRMRLKKHGNYIFFYNEWQEFAKYYSLGYGCYLSFKYEGNSKFSVIIFDVTSVEICYPLKTPSTNGETNTQCPTPRKSSRVETSGSQVIKLKIRFGHAFKNAEVAANEFNPKNPYFCSKIAKRNLVNVTAKFAQKYLMPNVPIALQNSQGKHWKVHCVLYNPKSFS